MVRNQPIKMMVMTLMIQNNDVIMLVSRYLGQFIEVTSERLYQNIPNLLLLVDKVLRFKISLRPG